MKGTAATNFGTQLQLKEEISDPQVRTGEGQAGASSSRVRRGSGHAGTM
jgi:hypothetical protein